MTFFNSPKRSGWMPGTSMTDGSQLKIRCGDRQVVSVNMLFAWNSFILSYHSREWRVATGKRPGA